MLDLIT